MTNGAVGYQILDDGTIVSLGLVFGSAAALFVGTGYIALDTGFSWTNYFASTLQDPNRSYSLYTLYQLLPLVFLSIYFLLELILVLRVLGEKKPMRKSACPNRDGRHTDLLQSIFSALVFSSPLVKSSNMSLAFTFAQVSMARSMGGCSKSSLLSWRS